MYDDDDDCEDGDNDYDDDKDDDGDYGDYDDCGDDDNDHDDDDDCDDDDDDHPATWIRMDSNIHNNIFHSSDGVALHHMPLNQSNQGLSIT